MRAWASARPFQDFRGRLKQVVLGLVLDDADQAHRLLPDARQYRRRDVVVTGSQAAARALRDPRGQRTRRPRHDQRADTMAVLEAEKIQYILGVREFAPAGEVRAEIIEGHRLYRAAPTSRPRKARPNWRSGKRRSLAGAMSSAATRRKPKRTPRRAPSL